jgi:capsular polysaccharide transport system permease protein
VRALFITWQVIYAVLLRETKTRYGQSQLGYVWALIEPTLWVGTFAGMYWFLGRQGPSGMPMFEFLVSGIVPFALFIESVSRSATAIGANQGLLYYPHVRPLDLVVARVLLEYATKVVVFALLMIAAACLQGTPLRADQPLKVFLGLVLASGLGMGLGLILCGLGLFFSVVERLQSTLLRPLFWLSGLFYSIDELPSAAQKVLLLNPLLHVIEIVRSGWFVTHESRLVTIWYPLLWTTILLFFGLTFERVARRRLHHL